MKRKIHPVVLIHGLWLTPRSFTGFRHYFAERGYEVHVPAWPGVEGEVEQVRKHPESLAGIGLQELVDFYQAFVAGLPERPILMGHSLGGLVVQMLLDRGLGVAGVALASAPPKGVWGLPMSVRFACGVLGNSVNSSGLVELSFPQFRDVFANNTCVSEAQFTFDRLTIPAPARPIRQVTTANLNPFAVSRVNFDNETRAPLLFVAGELDRKIPPSLVRENCRCYARSAAVTEYHEFPRRSHLMITQTGWQDVADYSIRWCEKQLPPMAALEQPVQGANYAIAPEVIAALLKRPR
jgi:pimeloyl-ACP methyl ester carboxylesterase